MRQIREGFFTAALRCVKIAFERKVVPADIDSDTGPRYQIPKHVAICSPDCGPRWCICKNVLVNMPLKRSGRDAIRDPRS